MENFGALFDQEYETSTKMFDNINPDFFLHESVSIFPSVNSYFNSCSQGSSNSTGMDTSALFAIGDHGNDQNDHQPYNDGDVNSLHDHITNNMFEPMSFYGGYIFPDNVMSDILSLNAEISCTNRNVGPVKEIQLKRKYEEESAGNQDLDIRPLEDKSEDFSPECRKKKSRISRNVDKNQRDVQKSKRNKKAIEDKDNTNEEGINNNNNDVGNRKQSLLSGSSSDQDDHISNDSQEVINGETGSIGLNSTGKARASRGSATDPQSLYARRRRERISERLRILQNLVPNGTKVDISTMLEEAVHYVKFLQLQIKLLSSDEMWMYAPIADNGMDLGMFQQISPLN